MIRAFNTFFTTIGFVLLLSFATFAQTADTSFEIEKFRELATRAESVVSNGQASTDALEILRSDLVKFRSEALKAQELRARRAATIQEQITALGAAPEGDVQEADQVANRRTELNGQLAEARAPLIVAQEAFGRASGLIAEIDKIIRGRARTALLQANKTPINPVLWSEAIQALGKHIGGISTEIRTEWSSDLSKQVRRQNGPVLLLLMAIGLIFMIPLTRWVTRRLIRERSKKPTPLGNIKLLLASSAVLLFPIIGFVCIFSAVYILDIFALRGDMLLGAIPSVGLTLLCANWLARHMPLGKIVNEGGENLDDDTKLIPAAQRLTWAMGAIIASGYLISGLDDGASWPVDIFSTLMFPLIVLLGYCLFQGGRLIAAYRKILHIEEGVISIPERIASLFMWACYLTGLGGPLLAAFGYFNAGEMLVFSMSMTLALSGTLFFIYNLLVRFISPPVDASKSTDRPSGGLYKIAIAFALICVSVPIFALIWGARVSDIYGLWFTLNEGVALGDTRISISDFLIFILIFFIGYTITRLLQTTLRTIVFPSTKIESGAQNALVTGFGYVGIFLAAILAITSTGLDLSSLAIVAGALSLGIGFGLQAIVSNFVSGIILLIERPVKIGDWVEVGAYSGTIRKVSVRSTSVETFDGATVIIPNADLIAGTVTNWTHGNVRGRVKVPVGVAYGTDPELVQKVLLAIADDHPMVLKLPAPIVVFMGFGADSMDFQLRGILRDVNYVLGTMSDINFEIVKRFKVNNIEIPFAQREVTIKNAQDFFPKAAKPARKLRAKPKT
jgi:small-conductance mechanosensitive channel